MQQEKMVNIAVFPKNIIKHLDIFEPNKNRLPPNSGNRYPFPEISF